MQYYGHVSVSTGKTRKFGDKTYLVSTTKLIKVIRFFEHDGCTLAIHKCLDNPKKYIVTEFITGLIASKIGYSCSFSTAKMAERVARENLDAAYARKFNIRKVTDNHYMFRTSNESSYVKMRLSGILKR